LNSLLLELHSIVTEVRRPAWTLMWYVLREFLVTFALTLAAVTLLWLLLLSFGMASELDNFGITLADVLMLSPFMLPHAAGLSLPPATLIATVMVMGRLSAESEILAAQAGGASLRRFVWPLVAGGVLVSGLTLWLEDAGVTWGNQTIRTQVLKINKPEFFESLDKPGKTISPHSDANNDMRINVLQYETDKEGKVWRPVQIVDFAGGKVVQTLFARNHTFKVDDADAKNPNEHNLSIILDDVQIYTDRFVTADNMVIKMPLPDIGAMIPIGNQRGQKSWRENLNESKLVAASMPRRYEFTLRRASDFGALAAASSPLNASSAPLIISSWNDTHIEDEQLETAKDRLRQDQIEYHRKIAIGILPLSMMFLGVGLGLLVKKNNRMIGFLLGVATYATLYYPLTIVAKSLSSSGNWDAMPRFIPPPQYLPNLIFLLMGYGLWRAFERGRVAGMPPWATRLLRRMRIINSAPDGEMGMDEAGLGALDPRGLAVGGDLDAPQMARRNTFRGSIASLWGEVYAFVETIVKFPLRLLFRRTVDVYVASTFLVPFVVIVVCLAGFISAIDIIDHFAEILDGIRKAGDPLGNLPVRSEWQALRDVFVYYGIQAVDYTLELLPLEVLIAGLLCAMQLVRNQEHLILKSSGMRLQRALRPAVLLALMACLGVSAIREYAVPSMMLRRDFLKPQVYHRNSTPSSLALYTVDEKRQPILFEMGQYNSIVKIGRDLHVYLIGEKKNERIPLASSDVAVWNIEKELWELWTDPAVQEQKQIEQSAGSLGGGKGKGGKTGPVTGEKSTANPDKNKPDTSAETARAKSAASITAVATAVRNSGPPPLNAAFNAVNSKAADAKIVSYEWDFGDKTAGSGKTATHLYEKPGLYTATLTVKDSAGNSSTASVQVDAWIRGGLRQRWEIVPTAIEIASAGPEREAMIPLEKIVKAPLEDWQGPINPKFIDSDRLGVKVMTLNELRTLSEFKPELMVEFYKRIGEFLMGVLLLWCALPLMLSDNRTIVVSIGTSILFGAVYWGLCKVSERLAAESKNWMAFIPHGPWLPLVPHAIFLVIGWVQFYWKMET